MNDHYAAGLIDGEGWIGIQRTTLCYQVRLKVNMSDKGLPALKALQRAYGGRIEASRPGSRPEQRATQAWALSGEAAGNLIERLRPLLLVKANAADAALEFHRMLVAAPKRPSRGREWTDGMRDTAHMLMLRVQEANRRGPDPALPNLPQGEPTAIYRWGWWWEPNDDLFGPVEFCGAIPPRGRMIAGHIFAEPSTTDPDATETVRALPTPRARDHKTGGKDGLDETLSALLPTPNASLGRGTGTPSTDTAQARFDQGKRYLDDAVALLPTPSVADVTGGHKHRSGARSNELLLPGVAVTLLSTPTSSLSLGVQEMERQLADSRHPRSIGESTVPPSGVGKAS